MKSYSRIGFIPALSILLGLAWVVPGLLAEEGKGMDTTLKGLRGIFVQVVPVGPETREKGFIDHQLKKDAEQQIWDAGIKTLTIKEYDRLKRSRRYPLARLDLTTSVHDIKGKDVMVFDIVVQVRQVVFLARKPVINIMAPTWEKRKLGYSESLPLIHKEVRKAVTRFIDAYTAANPETR